MELIGDEANVIGKARTLLEQGQAQLGLQVLDVLIQAQPENIEARKLRIDLMTQLGADDTCLMSRNSWVYFIDKDRKFLEENKA